MTFYLTISQGPSADEAVPVLATSERGVIQAVFDALRRLGESPPYGGARPPVRFGERPLRIHGVCDEKEG